MTHFNYKPNSIDANLDVSTLFNLDWIEIGKARKEYWWSYDSRTYTYGKEPYSRSYNSQPYVEIFSEFLKFASSDKVGIFINYYEDGRNSLGWHSDDDPGIDQTLPLLVFSFGGERNIQFAKQPDVTNITDVFLEDRSLLTMLPGCQENMYHRIPKVGRIVAPRVSVTLRHLKER